MSLLARVRRLAGRMRRVPSKAIARFTSRGLILAYHRVAKPGTDPQLLAVQPSHFREHLEVLQSRYRPTSLRQIAEPVFFPGRRDAVAITFDDGYADNLYSAAPLLEEFAVPATIFVTSGFVDNAEEFYWDELEKIILAPERLPAALNLQLGSHQFRFAFENDVRGSAGGTHSQAWNVTFECISDRQRAYSQLCTSMKLMSKDDRRSTLDRLAEWSGVARTARSDFRVMTRFELQSVAKSELIEIGAHSVNHPSMTTLAHDELEREVTGSKETLENVLGLRVTSFAFPYGERTDFDANSVSAVRRAGFERACINCTGLLTSTTDPWMLPRYIVRDWNGDQFARQLDIWLGRKPVE